MLISSARIGMGSGRSIYEPETSIGSTFYC